MKGKRETMRRLTLRIAVALVTFVIGVTVSMLWIVNRSQPAPQTQVVVKEEPGTVKNAEVSFKDGRVDYKGISFAYDTAIFSEARTSAVTANPLEDEFTESL
jgi:hypothetical protein